jgi:hypothetical protein
MAHRANQECRQKKARISSLSLGKRGDDFVKELFGRVSVSIPRIWCRPERQAKNG